MKLKFVKRYLSIADYDDVDLPDFTILTGLNGSGKTHLLKSFEHGHSIIEGYPVDGHGLYYNFSSFALAENRQGAGRNKSQSQRAWWQLGLWHRNASIIFNDAFVEIVENRHTDHYKQEIGEFINLWSFDEELLEDQLTKRINKYVKRVEKEIFQDPEFNKGLNVTTLIKVVKDIGKPFHEFGIKDYEKYIFETTDVGFSLSTSLSALYRSYKVAEHEYVYDKIESKNGSIDKEELAKEFKALNPRPWVFMNEILEELHLSGGGGEVFNFKITDPGDALLRRNPSMRPGFSPQLIDKCDGRPRSFTHLSSGETILLALAISIFETSNSYNMPKLLLLDEIDATLHPSMIKALIGTLQKTFVEKGTKVILATHSPTTIALAPEDSVYVVNKGIGRKKIESQSKQDAMKLVTQGYATLTDGLSIFDQISNKEICIITEGKNWEVLKKACALHGQSDVHIIPCFEGNSGVSQLKTLFDFFKIANHKTKVLFVWDCDVESKYGNLKPENNTFPFILPKNPENAIAKKGIENMFPESVFNNFITTVERPDRKPTKTFDSGSKANFHEQIMEKGTLEDFSNFSYLIDKLEELKTL